MSVNLTILSLLFKTDKLMSDKIRFLSPLKKTPTNTYSILPLFNNELGATIILC